MCRYNKKRRKNVLTESTVLAVPVHVMEGQVGSNDAGVTVNEIRGAGEHSWGAGEHGPSQPLRIRLCF